MNLDDLLKNALADLAAVKTSQDLEQYRIKYLGTKGLLKDAAYHLKTLPGPEKRGYGQKMNEVKNAITAAFEEAKAKLESGPKAVTGIDITEPGRLAFDNYRPGSLHIITQTIHELTSLFARMGFTVAEGPEVEDDFHNFEALNIPKIHPARDPLDNFYLDRPSGASPFMLRSQTSSVQIRVMETQKPPIRIVAPGRVYRPDTVDATHLFQFHQLEELGDLFFDLGRGEVVEPSVELKHLAGRRRLVKPDLLHGEADALVDLDRVALEVEPVDRDLPTRALDEVDEHVHRRRLPRPVRPEEAVELPLANVKADPSDGLDVARISLSQILYFDDIARHVLSITT